MQVGFGWALQNFLSPSQVPIHVVSMDVRDIPAIQELPELLPQEFQEIDILVNNAGLALGMAPIQDNNVDDIQTMVQTNITSLLVFCRVFIPGMVKVCGGVFLSGNAKNDASTKLMVVATSTQNN